MLCVVSTRIMIPKPMIILLRRNPRETITFAYCFASIRSFQCTKLLHHESFLSLARSTGSTKARLSRAEKAPPVPYSEAIAPQRKAEGTIYLGMSSPAH